MLKLCSLSAVNDLINTEVIHNNIIKNKFNKKQLGYYLAGLIESDGTLIVPKKDSKNTPTRLCGQLV